MVVEFIGQVRKHHNELFVVTLYMDVVFVFSKKDFNLVFKFILSREVFASRQPTDFGIKNVSHFTLSFLRPKVGRAGDFWPRMNEVDHFDRHVHNFHQI